MSQPILEATDLYKRYGEFTAVNGMSFSVGAGEIVGFLGPNGAGKTTTISMILGLLEPTAGSINIFGESLHAHRAKIAHRMNFSASFSLLPGNLTVWENLHIFGLLYGVSGLKYKIDRLLQLTKLERFVKTKTGMLSSGEQSRLSIAKALLNDPELLLLDEPTASLDPQSAREIRSLVQKHVAGKDRAIIWTSHNMHEIEAVCNRVIFVSKGRILLEGDPKTLPAKYEKADLEELFISVANESLHPHE